MTWTDTQVHLLPSHKQAVLNIMLPVSSRAEWANVMEHMTDNGRKRDNPGQAEGDVLRFLNYGHSLNKDLTAIFDNINAHPDWEPDGVGNSYLEDYLAHRRKLAEAFPPGYEVALFGTPEYDMLVARNGEPAPTFAMIAPFEQWRDHDGLLDSETRLA